ncbi:hypothetical protein [Yoonia sp. R2-816]|uniref:hypothetical protein n=1 Tax=Yoonia sp. R2-816 TaxID=3342638 RepID=UPI003729B38C
MVIEFCPTEYRRAKEIAGHVGEMWWTGCSTAVGGDSRFAQGHDPQGVKFFISDSYIEPVADSPPPYSILKLPVPNGLNSCEACKSLIFGLVFHEWSHLKQKVADEDSFVEAQKAQNVLRQKLMARESITTKDWWEYYYCWRLEREAHAIQLASEYAYQGRTSIIPDHLGSFIGWQKPISRLEPDSLVLEEWQKTVLELASEQLAHFVVHEYSGS